MPEPAPPVPPRPPVVPRGLRVPFAILALLFALWGVANNLTDVLLATFKRVMSMSDLQTSWIQVAFYGSYFCLALPAALLVRRFDYKAGLLVGLGLFCVGALGFYPASRTMEYAHFLSALFVLAAGLSVLETTANPYVLALGPEETATRRLNAAQAFNPLGSIAGVAIGKLFILSELSPATAEERAAMAPAELAGVREAELAAVMTPYVAIACLIAAVWLLIAFWPFPRAKAEPGPSLRSVGGSLFRRPRWVFGVLTQFFYIGAQIGVWSFTIRYVMQERGVAEDAAGSWYLASIVLFAVSRFVAAGLMTAFRPSRLMAAAAAGGVACALVAWLAGGLVGCVALVGMSVCMSLMFPTIYGIALSGLTEGQRKVGAAGLIMAILGGAVLTVAQGAVSDAAGIRVAFLVPAGCFAVVLAYALLNREPDAAPAG